MINFVPQEKVQLDFKERQLINQAPLDYQPYQDLIQCFQILDDEDDTTFNDSKEILAWKVIYIVVMEGRNIAKMLSSLYELLNQYACDD